MKKYVYSGPFSGVTLKTTGGEQEVLFHDGKTYDLPDHEYVKTLEALGHLTRVVDAPEGKKAAVAQ